MKRSRRKWSLLLIVCLVFGCFPGTTDVQSENSGVKNEAVEVPTVCYRDPAPVVDPSSTTSYCISFEVKKDGVVWNDSGKEYALCPQGSTVSKGTLATDAKNNYDYTEEQKTDGIIRVVNGYYDIYEVLDTDESGYVSSYEDTGLDVTVSSSYVSESTDVRTIAVDYYTVSFYDGTAKMQTPQEQIVLKGEKAQEPSETPKKQNFEFEKWVSGEDSDEKFDFENTGITAATQVYASWKQLDGSYKEEYYLQNAEDDEYPQEPVSSETFSGKAGNRVTATQKQFPGFSIVSVEENSLPSISSTETVVVKYYYKRNSYALTWNANGGEIHDTAYTTGQVRYGKAIQAPTNLTRDGYIFDGWDKEPAATMPAEELEYTAQWIPAPTAPPTPVPTIVPTTPPTAAPAAEPTTEPTTEPTAEPTTEPTAEPAAEPAAEPTAAPAAEPTTKPTAVPTKAPVAASTQASSSGEVAVMHAQILPKGDGIQKLEWEKVKGADGYIIYYASCSSKLKKLTTIAGGSVTSYIKKNCEDNQFYKYQIRGYKLVKGKKKIISKSWVCHGINVNEDSKYTNVKEVKVKESSITVKVGKKEKFNKKGVTFVKKEAGKILASEKHCDRIRLQSSDKSIAKVKKGKIIGKKAGKCTLYVIAPSGKYASVSITVKE